MNIIESYALTCGAKIDRPFIYEDFCPLPQGKYISIQTSSGIDSLNYSYWRDVMDEAMPTLSKAGIKVIQVGRAGGPSIVGAIDYRGKASANQLAYVIKHSSLHLSADDFSVHLAAYYDKPLIALYGPTYAENTGPYYGDKSKQILFKAYERVGNKPSMAAKEPERALDTITPEEIADAVFKLLDISATSAYKTVHMGIRYGREIITDFLPNQIIQGSFSGPLDVRMDISFNEAALAEQLRRNKCRIFTDKPIRLEILKSLRANIDSIFYFIGADDSPEFVRDIADLGIKLALMSYLPASEVQAKKIKYYEFGSINLVVPPDVKLIEKLKGVAGLHYKSSQTVYSKGKKSLSFAAEKLGIEASDDWQAVIDTPEFWQDADNFRFAIKA